MKLILFYFEPSIAEAKGFLETIIFYREFGIYKCYFEGESIAS